MIWAKPRVPLASAVFQQWKLFPACPSSLLSQNKHAKSLCALGAEESLMLETMARRALNHEFNDIGRVARKLAAARTLNAAGLDIRLGATGYCGDISHTETFAKFCTTIRETFPDIKNVRFETRPARDKFSLPSAWVVLDLRDPAAPAQGSLMPSTRVLWRKGPGD
jgi:hypothetical protein